MSPQSRHATRENIVDESSKAVPKSKRESKATSVIVSYNYEAAVGQPDIPTCWKIDDKARSPCSSFDGALSTSIDRRKFYARGKASATVKKRGVGFRSRVQTKKITRAHSQTRDVVELEDSSEITRDIATLGMEKSGIVAACEETPSNLRQVCPNNKFTLTPSFTLIKNSH